MENFFKKSDSEIEAQNNASEYYGIRYSGYGLSYHKSIIEEMMEGAKGKILDAGCGTGIISDLYPELNIIGVDPSPGMIEKHRGTCIQAYAERLPFSPCSFDFVVCRSVLHHLKNPQIALKEIRRVLKHGGKFVCWETNKGALAHLVRSATQHGDRFSEYLAVS